MDSASHLNEAAWQMWPEGLIWLDLPSGVLRQANPAALDLLDHSVGRVGEIWGACLTPACWASLQCLMGDAAAWSGRGLSLQLQDGRQLWGRCMARASDGDGSAIGLLSLSLSQTSLVDEADKAQARLSATLDALHQSFTRFLGATSEAALLSAACEGVTASGRFALAWIGLADHGNAHRIDVLAHAGEGEGYLRDLQLGWGGNWAELGVAGQAIRSGQSVIKNRLEDELGVHPLSARAVAHGLRAVVAIPLISQGQVLGALTVFSAQTDAFGPTEVVLFEQLAANVVLALREFDARRSYLNEAVQRAATAHQFETVLEQTIETLSAALAERDPYTVGHQRRVAELAVQLGQHLGLSPQRCRVLHLAAVVHDIGKIRVPIELLTKPTPLRQQEFEVIKQHAQATIDILGGIDWPWPLKDIAGQHHERLDGSGYPAGLKGDQILLEARILAVADTIESMTAARPYRPAKGMDAALAALSRERGTKLDADVVDAALALWHTPGESKESGGVC